MLTRCLFQMHVEISFLILDVQHIAIVIVITIGSTGISKKNGESNFDSLFLFYAYSAKYINDEEI